MKDKYIENKRQLFIDLFSGSNIYVNGATEGVSIPSKVVESMADEVQEMLQQAYEQGEQAGKQKVLDIVSGFNDKDPKEFTQDDTIQTFYVTQDEIYHAILKDLKNE